MSLKGEANRAMCTTPLIASRRHDGRLQIKGSGYIDVQYNKKTKKFNNIQVYYPCAAGPPRASTPRT